MILYIYARAYVFAIKRLNDPFSLIFARLIRFLLKRKKGNASHLKYPHYLYRFQLKSQR